VANEDSALKEVDQELAEERQWAMFQKYGPSVISGAVAIVLAVGGWQFWNARQDAAASQKALEFSNAVDLLTEDETEGRAALQAISEEGSGGYGILAALQRAASFSRGGERLAAANAYREIYNNPATPKNIKEIARLRAAYLSLSDGRDVVMADLGDLAEGDSAYVYSAREISGLAALESKDYETALAIFRQLSVDIGSPPSIRTRAEDFAALAASGKSGVNITGEARIDDLLSAIGDGVEEAVDAGGEVGAQDPGDQPSSDGDVSENTDAPALETAPEAAPETDADPASEKSENE
jgi:hypothetical protein